MSSVLHKVLWHLKVKVVSPLLNSAVEHCLFNCHHIYGDKSRVRISKTAQINNAVLNTNGGEIVVEDWVFFGHGVSLLTGIHDYHKFKQERITSGARTGRDIVIKSGAWISSNATVLGPCVIGEDAVVAAGSVVVSDVASRSLVAGIPAKLIKTF